MSARFVILGMLMLNMLSAMGQVVINRKDSVVFGVPLPGILFKDSLRHHQDTSELRDGKAYLKQFEKAARSPFIAFRGGYAGYSLNYRSALDTPYTDKNLTQHQIQSNLNFLVGGLVPIRVNSFIRRSNSSIFKDITDIQVAFDAAAYRNGLSEMLRKRLLAQIPSPDSIVGKLYKQRLNQTTDLENWLQDPLTRQKLIEANEVIQVPHISDNMQLPDSVNRQRGDSIRKEAKRFLELYTRIGSIHDSIAMQRDSLKGVYDASVSKVLQYRNLTNGPVTGPSSYDQLMSQLSKYGSSSGSLSPTERWLMGVRSFGLGKNNVNTSELTAKNLPLNGVHFEYNSWYILGLTAGLIDYRFRDFIVNKVNQPKQYMYMVKAGLGRLDKNYFMLSWFGGQKQLLTSVYSSGQFPLIHLTGLSATAKWQVERNTYLLAEAAQSFSPPLAGSETTTKSSWSLSDRSNKALSLKLASSIPATDTRIEGQYKFTGANYQSFNAWQTSAQQIAWYGKVEQSFWHRQLKFVASLRSNDFSNPYIIQNYSSNTVFKTLSLTFRKKGLPILTASYIPMSQLTKVGDTLEESRFQTVTVSASHFYKLGQRQASTNIVYTKFFNSSADSAFIYYNSVNLYAGQTLFFRDFTATVALSYSKSSGYEYNVLEGNLSIPLTRSVSIGMGAKLNELNGTATGVGGFFDTYLSIGNSIRLSIHMEKGYLPGSGSAARLTPNDMGTISLIKTFK